MMFGPLLLIGLVVLAIWFFREQERRRTPGGTGTGTTNALEILRERYASGEISWEAFERMWRALESGPGAA